MGVAKDRGGLGFKNLESFNQPMLAKQCWRLLTNPNSLAAKVIKEKDFKQSNLLESRLGSKPSFIWRSL